MMKQYLQRTRVGKKEHSYRRRELKHDASPVGEGKYTLGISSLFVEKVYSRERGSRKLSLAYGVNRKLVQKSPWLSKVSDTNL